jgi:cell division protein FtsL
MKKLNKRRATKRILSRFIAHNRRLYPFFFHMGPVALCITSVLLIGLMAILYLSQVGQTVSANQQMEDIHSQQSVIQRQDQDLVDTIAQERSPSYIARNARKQGLVPVDPKDIQTVVVPHLQPIPTQQGPVETP